MQSHELVNLLADYGFSLRVEGERLAVAPSSRLTDDIRDAIRTHKPAIIELAHNLDDLIDAWRRGPRTEALGAKLKAVSVLQPVVRSFSHHKMKQEVSE